MDLGESGRILLERIAKLEPAYAGHIIAHLLLQEDAEQKFIRYSGCSDAEVREMIDRVKAELHRSGRLNSPPFLRRRTVYVSPPTASSRSPTHRETQFPAKNIAGGMPMGGPLDPVSELENQTNFLSLGDRPGPHGQHSVILAEDAHKYMASSSGRKDPGPVVPGSRHIYITFAPDSTFTVKDVRDYFSTFGPVEDVRLPRRKKRMFGFVTFESHETVRLVFNKGNPHIVGDAQILAKPYREKSMLIDRMDNERVEPPIFGPPPYIGMANEFQSSPPVYGNMGMLGTGLMEERQMPSPELQRRRHLAELQMARNQMAWSPMGIQSYFGDYIDGVRVSEEHFDVSSADHFNQMLGFLNSDSDHDGEKDGETNDHTDRDSQDLNLPDSPFASPG